MKRGGVRSAYLPNCDKDTLEHRSSIYDSIRHALLAFVMGWFVSLFQFVRLLQ